MKCAELSEREHAIMNEAFMVGRAYSALGEKESPAEIHAKLAVRCAFEASKVEPSRVLPDNQRDLVDVVVELSPLAVIKA